MPGVDIDARHLSALPLSASAAKMRDGRDSRSGTRCNRDVRRAPPSHVAGRSRAGAASRAAG